MFTITKAFKAYMEDGRATIFLRRDKNDITDIYVNSFQFIIRKFKDPKAEIIYKRTKSEGFLAVYLKGHERPFLYFMALNQEKSNFKSLVIGDIAYICMDEFIIDTRQGEKYISDEVGKLQELYETFNREASKPIRCYFLGNPYSLYNPYFIAFGIDPKKLRKGAILTGPQWAVERYVLKPELVAQIRRKNPMFDQFANDAWAKYALEGEAVNDSNIRIGPKPPGFTLESVIIFEGRYYGIWHPIGFAHADPLFFVSREERIGSKRTAYAFDFADLVTNAKLYGKEDKAYLARFKRAVQHRLVLFQDLDCSYTIENVFTAI